MADEKNTYPHVYPLKKPVQLGSETITEINYRDAVAKDIRKMRVGPAAEKMELGDLLDIFTSICDQNRVVIDKLSPADCFAVTEIVNGFFPDGQ